jgi:hypothetical protein
MRNIKLGSASAALLVALALVLRTLVSSGEDTSRLIEHEWFFDLERKTLFKAPRDSLPPLDPPSGAVINGQPAGVKAYVYACGEGCDDEAKRFVGYLETYTPAARSTMRTPAPDANVLYQGHLVADAQQLQWHLASSPDGQRVQSSSELRCKGLQPAKPCYP